MHLRTIGKIKMKKLIIIFLTVTVSLSAQFDNWEYWDVMSKPVAGGDVWVDGEEVLYIFGGYSDSLQTYVDWVQKYRPLYTTSKILDNMTEARYGLVAEPFNDFALLFGGLQTESASISGIEKWNTFFTDEAIFTYNNNFNRNFSTGHIIEGNYFIVGGNALAGTNSEHLPYIVEYNLIDSNITYQFDSLFLGDDLPEQQMSEVLNDNIYIFGGVINGVSQDIYKFNTVEKALEKLDVQLLQPRAGGRAVADAVNNKIYIIGGYNEENKALNTVEVFYAFGNDNYYLEESAPINDARYNFMAAKVFDHIYVLGGFNEDDDVVSSVERYFYNAAVVNIEEGEDISEHNKFELYQNYPNPFNPVTSIQYSIPNNVEVNFELTTRVLLNVYDVLGNKIKTLVDKRQSPGKHSVSFNGAGLPSGIYFYQLSINGGRNNSFLQTKKMILAK